MSSGPDPTGRVILTVERAADVLNAFTEADGETLGVTELARHLSLSKAVVHRILTSLRGKGLIELDEATRRYSLGPAALALGLTYLESIDVRDLARPVLKELSERTDETATLSVRRGDIRFYVEQVTPSLEVKMSVQLGHPYPLHAGSSSKAFLAHLVRGEVDAILSRDLQALTSKTITQRERLEKELELIRRRGYATSLGERQEGAGSVAAPVFDHEGRTVAVISVCGPAERFAQKVDNIAPLLLDATQKLSWHLGWKHSVNV